MKVNVQDIIMIMGMTELVDNISKRLEKLTEEGKTKSAEYLVLVDSLPIIASKRDELAEVLKKKNSPIVMPK